MEEKIFFKDSKNYFTYYSASTKTLPLVVIIPGGGYDHTSKREAMNVANYFMPLGFHACIVNYREQLDKYPTPQEEVSYVINYFRTNSAKYNVNPDKILGIGFSAGGHLLLSESIYHNEFYPNSLVNGLVLCYPVITSDNRYWHSGSFKNLLTDEKLYDKLSLEKHLTNELPDTFIWHTFTDESVNVMNTLLFLEEAKKIGINCEAHIFPKGSHGMSLADDSMLSGGKALKDDYIHEWTNYLKNYLKLKEWI